MLRTTSVVVALSLLLLPSLAQPRHLRAADERLVNGGFEAATVEPWQALYEDTLHLASCEPRSGANAGALTVESYNYVAQTVAVAPNATYGFTGYVYSSGIGGGGSVAVRVLWYEDSDGVNLISHSEWDRLEPPPPEYAVIQGSGTAPPEAHYAQVRIEAGTVETGTVCLDDLSFSGPAPSPATPTPEPTETAVPTPEPSPTPSSTATSIPTQSPTRTATPTAVPMAVGSLLNGGFEEASADGVPIGWRKFGGALSRSSAYARSGVYSGAYSSDSLTTKWAYQVVGVEPNQAYAFEGYVLTSGPPASQAYLRVSWYASADASGQLLGSADSADALNGGEPSFRYVTTGAVVAPGDAHSAKLRVMLSPASSSSETLYLDDFGFFETEPPTATPAPTLTPSPTSTSSRTPTPTAEPTSTPATDLSTSPTAAPAEAGGLLNPGFEDARPDGSPVGWQKFGGALSRSSAYARSGAYSGAFRSESDATKWAYQVVRVDPNQAYEFEGYVLTNGQAASLAYLRVSWYASADGSGQLLSNSDSEESLGGGNPTFRHLSTRVVVSPPAAHSARVRVMLAPASPARETIYLDDFSFSQRAAPPPGGAPAAEPPSSDPSAQRSGGSLPPTAQARSPDGGAVEVRGATDPEESGHGVKINEVCYDTDHGGEDYAHEWVELYNAGRGSVDLAGWSLVDNTSRDSLPRVSLEPGAFAVVAASAAFEADHPTYEGLLIVVNDGKIGNGLSNRGDRLTLLDGRGRSVDALSYGDDSGVFRPPVPPVEPGHCLERTPVGFDNDTARDFRDSPRPSPGFASHAAAVAGTPTATPLAGSAGVSLARGISSATESSGEGAGFPWLWVILGGLIFAVGVGVGAGTAYRRRRHSGG